MTRILKQCIWACAVPYTATAVDDIKWVWCLMLIETGVPMNLFFLGYSGNQEVSWHHLNQISNPTVRNITIKVTGLENLYMKDNKYVSNSLWYILIFIDCNSTYPSAKSCCHPALARFLSLDSSKKEILCVCERAGRSDSVHWIQLISIHSSIKSQPSRTTLSKANKSTHVFLVIKCSCSSRSWCHMQTNFDAEYTSVSQVYSSPSCPWRYRTCTEWSTSEMNPVFIQWNFRRC